MGDDRVETLMEARSASERWDLIFSFAATFGFMGIQLGQKYQDVFQLSLTDAPESIRKSFRLTYHIGGVAQLNEIEDEWEWERIFSEMPAII